MQTSKKRIIKTTVIVLLAICLLALTAFGTVFAVREKRVAPLQAVLKDKKISFLGDSITTYEGVSNGTEINDTLGENLVYYRKEDMQQTHTWWQRIADRYGMEVLVNNAWSGSTVSSVCGEQSAGWNTRAVNLHDNTLADNPEKQPVNPDIIVVYLGINDYGRGVQCTGAFDGAFWTKVQAEGYSPVTFDEAYAVMIYRIKQAYPQADVFVCNIPKSACGEGEELEQYNAAIARIGSWYGCTLVDFYTSKMSEKYARYTKEGLHPNRRGMRVMADCIATAFTEKYLSA